ncbi:ATP-synt F domain containing protein [Asbolus verrucosus]|uniref:V-type proton ATPase subunit F n=1 Tax=Asbolus verrucosus TaxID=1661398 RepID=A0A482WEC9_ASBVE|nr:ATP-synt F domain containing protein [Asbolus verrucosus]
MATYSSAPGKLISVIGDEDTCVGFLLGGIGEINKRHGPNFFVVNKDTTVHEIEDCFKRFSRRADIDIILITQNIADMIKHVLQLYKHTVPAVVEIPSKDRPFDAAKDTILIRATKMYTTEDLGL